MEEGESPTFAFLCEYDALPELGHACGHNLIGTSGAGAGVVLKEIMEKYGIGGTLKVFGTPAEENGSGKITMLDEGIFEGVDMSLIMHPSDLSMADDISFEQGVYLQGKTGPYSSLSLGGSQRFKRCDADVPCR